jgi:hypothetical protein
MYDEYSEQSPINIGPAIVAEIKMKELNIIIYAYCTPWNLILATCVVYNVVFFFFSDDVYIVHCTTWKLSTYVLRSMEKERF